LRAADDLSIATNQQGNNPFIGTFAISVTDQFATNDFNGLDLDFLYWSNVLRPRNVIDTGISTPPQRLQSRR
jgi:hypothetical protein